MWFRDKAKNLWQSTADSTGTRLGGGGLVT